MKKLLFIPFLILIFLNITQKNASANSCSYGSTQARVQKDTSDPWKKDITVGCERKFNVGSFHDGTGQFANDTTLNVSGPYMSKFYENGNTVTVNKDGNYTLSVRTKNQSGSSCEEKAYVKVTCGNSDNNQTNNSNQQCSYNNTQARVQEDANHSWKNSLDLKCGQSFRVGSFHNGVDKFASDTSLKVIFPNGNTNTYHNEDTINVDQKGTYKLEVTTNNYQNSSRCQDTARIRVSCPSSTPTPSTPPNMPSFPWRCQYDSTQARFQKDTNHSWEKEVEVSCGESFNVGSFHNGTGQFAGDTILKLDIPFWFDLYLKNGETVPAVWSGSYKLKVATISQIGKACQDEAKVRIKCSRSPWTWSQIKNWLGI